MGDSTSLFSRPRRSQPFTHKTIPKMSDVSLRATGKKPTSAPTLRLAIRATRFLGGPSEIKQVEVSISEMRRFHDKAQDLNSSLVCSAVQIGASVDLLK